MDNNVSNNLEQEKNVEHKVDVNNEMVSNTIKKGNKKSLPLLICVFGLVLLIVGVVLFLSKPNDGGGSASGTGQTEEKNPNGAFNLEIIKPFSEYKNYKINFIGEMGNEEATMKIESFVDVDAVNKIMKATIDMGGFKKYVYYDLNSNMHYISSDNSEWGKNTNNKAKLPDFDGIVSAIKDNNNITDEGNGVFTYKTKLVVNGELYNDVSVKASFDNNGYLKSLIYDLTDNIEGVTKYILTYNFSDVNKLGDVSIPNDVINNSKDTVEIVTIEF